MPNSTRMLMTLYRKEIIDAVILLALGLIAWWLAAEFHLLDRMLGRGENEPQGFHQGALTAIMIAVIAGSIYVVRKNNRLNEQIKQRKEADSNVAWIAQHDLLTKLPNRLFLQNFVTNMDNSSSLALDKHFVVYTIDLDGFKKVNDLLGHHGGDELLMTITDRLSRLAPNDLIVRVGGDEFIIIAEIDTNEDYREFAEDIVMDLSTPAKILDSHVEVGACVGVSLFPEDADKIAEVIRCADVAMYVAKNNGRGSIKRFQPWMDSLLIKRAEIEQSLRAAVKADEVVPHYQPLIDLSTGQICGFEALARWRDPSGEMVPPVIFIEIAEESGLITSLTEKLLRKCCIDARAWPDYIRLSFNVSPTQLTDKLLGLRILNILAETGWSPNRLEIEITESTLISDTETAIRILHDLHDAGVSIAIDDFGTGYSSLSQLSQFNFDKIKIDRSFVSNFEHDEKSRNVVKAMLSLGQGLGITTLAEGIETESQLENLKSLGCQIGQGYFFGKPCPASELEAVIRKFERQEEGRGQVTSFPI